MFDWVLNTYLHHSSHEPFIYFSGSTFHGKRLVESGNEFWQNLAELVPHPDVFWYHLNGMGTQKNVPKKVLLTLFPYIFHAKSQWFIVYKYLKTKIVSRDIIIPPQMHWTLNIFGPSATIIGGGLGITNLFNH